MRFAAIADVHGNFLALEAVLSDISKRSVERVVNLGDLVSGPLQPTETADRLMDLEMVTVRGNHERQLLETPLEKMGASDAYAASALSKKHFEWIRGLPSTMIFEGQILLCHGTPASDLQYFVETVTPDGVREATQQEIAARAGRNNASLILCGHTHLPRRIRLPDGRTVVNPGSVGLQAFADDRPFPHRLQTGSPHARYAILEEKSEGWSVEFVSVVYDWEQAARLAESGNRSDWASALRTGRVE